MQKKNEVLPIRRAFLWFLALLLIGGSTVWPSGGKRAEAEEARAGSLEWKRVYPNAGQTVDFRMAVIEHHNGIWIAAGPGSAARSVDGLHWNEIPPNELGIGAEAFQGIADVAYGNGVWIAVGKGGLVSLSADGLEWERQSGEIAEEDLTAVAYGEAGFVVVGSRYVYVSTDGREWVPHTVEGFSGNPQASADLKYVEGHYIYTSEDRPPYWSTDGTDWAVMGDPGSAGISALSSVTYDGSAFWGVSKPDTDSIPEEAVKVYKSADGRIWTGVQVDRAYDWIAYYLSGIDYADGLYTAVGYRKDKRFGNPIALAYTSVDGANWTEEAVTPNSGEKSMFEDVRTAGGLSVAVSSLGIYARGTYEQSGSSRLSALQISTTLQPGFDPEVQDYTAQVRRMIDAVSVSGSTVDPEAAVTINGQSVRSDGFSSYVPLPSAVTPIEIVVAATNGEKRLYTITVRRDPPLDTGHVWDKVYPKRESKQKGPWTSVEQHDGIWVAVGPNVPVVRSKDGTRWTEEAHTRFDATKKEYYGFRDVTYAGGMWIAAGDGGNIFTSADGLNWKRRTTKGAYPNDRINAVAYGEAGFVAVGYDVDGGDSPIYTSPDGVKWTRRTDSAGTSFMDIAYGEGRYAAIGDKTVYTSTDGVNWNQDWVEGTSGSSALSIAYDGSSFWIGINRLVEGTSRVLLLKSADALSWSRFEISDSPENGDYTVRQVNYRNGRYLVALQEFVDNRWQEAVYSSTDGATWERDVLNIGGSSDMTANAVASDGSRAIVVGGPGWILTREF